MKKFSKMKLVSLSLLSLIHWGSAATYSLQDWSDLQDNITVGTYQDEESDAIVIERTEGPSSDQDAIKIITDHKKYGGMWSSVWHDFEKAKAIQFKAKADKPGVIMMHLQDENKFRVFANIRIDSKDWQSFTIPMSYFKKSLNYQDASVQEDDTMDWSSVNSVSFDFNSPSKSSFYFGPMTVTDEETPAYTGLLSSEGKIIVQDYANISGHNGGVFKDDYGSTISMKIEKDTNSKNGYVASFDYDLIDEGWCGSWAESGYLWQGQNWHGAKEMEIRVFSEESIEIEMSFNDKNKNNYTAPTVSTSGTGWETLSIDFNDFSLNAYYQPDDSTPGAALDLSLIKDFNLNPKTIGKYAFKVDLVAVTK